MTEGLQNPPEVSNFSSQKKTQQTQKQNSALLCESCVDRRKLSKPLQELLTFKLQLSKKVEVPGSSTFNIREANETQHKAQTQLVIRSQLIKQHFACPNILGHWIVSVLQWRF